VALSKRREAKRGQIRVQIPGYAWDEALRDSFIADHEGWFERRAHQHKIHGELVTYVALLETDPARLLAVALERRAVVARLGNSGWALRRAALRIEADIAVIEGGGS
jgi:hypothetical protein